MAGELYRDGALNATRPTQVGGYANFDYVGGGVCECCHGWPRLQIGFWP